jgi:hypothetical protein
MRLRLHMRRSVVLTALAVALSLSPELKAASLSSELDGMFANATAPGSFNSQLRNCFRLDTDRLPQPSEQSGFAARRNYVQNADGRHQVDRSTDASEGERFALRGDHEGR